MKIKILIALIFLLLNANFSSAQTTEFTYQGSLRDGAAPANANYDFEFRLFSLETGGTPITTRQRPGVTVANGVFSVRLGFGAQFTGANRWLEIAVKPSASGGSWFQQLLPRHVISLTPYAVCSLNAATADRAAILSLNSQQHGGKADFGFGAEEVERIEPLRTTRSASGAIEGVKYAQITTVLVNAVNEQQAQIEELKEQNKQFQEQLKQQQQLDALKRFVCLQRAQAQVCK